MLPRLIVCIPGSNFSGKWLDAWTELYSQLALEYRVTCVRCEGNNIYQVRADSLAIMAEIAKDDPPQYVLWIDSDNIVAFAGFVHLRHALETLLEASAVGAWYLMQMHFGEPPQVTAGRGNDRPNVQTLRNARGQLLEVEFIGFGFLLMRWSVIEDLGLHAFTPVLRDDGDFEMDDVSYCLRARQKGHRIFLHSGVYSPHLKLLPVPVRITEAPADKPERLVYQ